MIHWLAQVWSRIRCDCCEEEEEPPQQSHNFGILEIPDDAYIKHGAVIDGNEPDWDEGEDGD